MAICRCAIFACQIPWLFAIISKFHDFSFINFRRNSMTFPEIPENFKIPEIPWLFHDRGNPVNSPWTCTYCFGGLKSSLLLYDLLYFSSPMSCTSGTGMTSASAVPYTCWADNARCKWCSYKEHSWALQLGYFAYNREQTYWLSGAPKTLSESHFSDMDFRLETP